MRAPRSSAGFTIVEVLIAMALLATVATGVAGLIATTIRAVRLAQDQTTTVVLAMQKMEQLRGLAWGLDSVLTDATTDLSTAPWTSAGTGLQPSPADALDANTPGYVDYLDARGGWVGAGAVPPAEAVYIRRWSVQPLQTHPADSLVLQVLVTTRRREATVDLGVHPRRRYAEDALVQTIKTRKAS